jgi:hypothetical protein
MAKKTKPLGGKKELDGERQGYVPGAPGIYEPFVIPEAGHEGARAVYEYGYMAEGRITDSNEPRDKFVDYDSCFIKVDGWVEEPK